MADTPLTDDQRALVEKNLDLAHHLAQAAWRKSPEMQDLEEIVAEAYVGLTKAASRFDPSRANVVNGVPDVAGAFSGYARQAINGAILDWQRKQDHVPKRQRSTYKELQRLGLNEGRSAEELAEITGMEPERVRAIIFAVENPSVSLNFTYSSSSNPESDSVEMDRRLPNHESVEASATEGKIRAAVVEAFDSLEERQRIAFAMRFYLGKDFATIASTLGTRVSQVRQMVDDANLIVHQAMVREAL